MQHLKKYLNQSGQIIRYYEMFIPKSGAAIKVEYRELPVLLSHKNNIVVMNQYNNFQLLGIKKVRGDRSGSVVSQVDSYVRSWGDSLLEYNGLVGSIYSFQSEKVIKRRVHNALEKLIAKEYGAYTNMSAKLEDFLRGNA